ncbi:MAG: response regulator [Desulfotignum sp.]|nr:response regulator [Desulfotignum sp.]MCF8089967.1 response regulator [Desulfotignum sp.]MCF8137040.1 response regulator [Desulfotignum sp.]
MSAATPAEAIKQAQIRSNAIDLLLSDVVLPEMSGRDLAGQIMGLCPGIRVLFMSGYTADVIAHQGVLDGGVAFIQKPFSMNQ